MLDNEIIQVIISIINAGLTAAGSSYAGLLVKQSNQPTQQGVPTKSTVFLTKLPDHRYGSLRREDKWDLDLLKMIHTETQQYESTFQIEALAIQNPKNINSLTAADIVNRVAAILQSDYALTTFRQNELGVERILDIRNPYFQDDKQRNEAVPSFDFILTHKQVIISESPIVETIEYNFNRV